MTYLLFTKTAYNILPSSQHRVEKMPSTALGALPPKTSAKASDQKSMPTSSVQPDIPLISIIKAPFLTMMKLVPDVEMQLRSNKALDPYSDYIVTRCLITAQ